MVFLYHVTFIFGSFISLLFNTCLILAFYAPHVISQINNNRNNNNNNNNNDNDNDNDNNNNNNNNNTISFLDKFGHKTSKCFV